MLINNLLSEMTRLEIQEKLGLTDKKNVLKMYIKPALEEELIEMTLPNKPNSRNQKYRLTSLGKQLQAME